MKKVLLLFIALIAICAKAQEMPSVAGVTFGWSYNQCKTVLDKKYNNGNDSYQITPNKLQYYYVNFGGEYFDYVNFEFQTEGTKTYLSRIAFYASFDLYDTTSLAEKKLDRLYKMYDEKYGLRWSFDDEDGKGCTFGHNPKNQDDAFIIIETFKGETDNGIMKRWVTVSYRVAFVDPKDEI